MSFFIKLLPKFMLSLCIAMAITLILILTEFDLVTFVDNIRHF
jgi:hypothetical protein